MIPRNRAGLVPFRPVGRGSRVAVVAPASPFDRADFDRGVDELRRLGLDPVYDDRVFAKQGFVAGDAATRAAMLSEAWTSPEIDAMVSARGGYGSVEVLPLLDRSMIAHARTAFIGYSDLTSLHVFLNCHVGATSVHGAMLEGRLSKGAEGYDADSFMRALGAMPMGELAPAGVEILNAGEASGTLLGGTITQLAASLGTPYDFSPPQGAILFLEEVGERPYRLHRLLTQLRLSGRLERASGIVFGQLPRCDEPGGTPTARSVIEEIFAEFPGPIVIGFPSGHTTTPFVSLPFGVHARLVAHGSPRLVLDEAAACA